ncbi:MAG: hypothetical protein A2X45_07145 [Lentisphaerae bacterium GWF2_50_93]|nr:MAG: hypothetical protein A2X45_07145 [Lentisphaerae bacterium GWF2_50_93]
MKIKNLFVYAALASGMLGSSLHADAAVGEIKIRSDFPGGNVVVQKIEAGKVQIAPDLRGGGAWFYWYFEAEVVQAGKVDFVFPEKMPGITSLIGMQGPALSLDCGKSWAWAGSENVKDNMFSYDFEKVGQKVRFAVTFPYLQSDLEAFIKENAGNKHLRSEILTKSIKGRNVEMFQIGEPGPGVKAMLMTARHHACESMVSFVLEGLIKSAVSDTPAGVKFREKYVLYVVPFVDKDGVEEGDQGKDRKPHDHNRDYGKDSIFPEVDAIESLADSKKIQLFLDFHCPTLRMDIHQSMYFVGTKQTPAHNEAFVEEFAILINKGLPPKNPGGPRVMLQKREPMEKGSNCNRYFSYKEGMIMAATLEVPYAPLKTVMDVDNCRKIGEAIFNAWVKMDFNQTNPGEDRAKFMEFQKRFKGSPANWESVAGEILNDDKSPALYRIEASNKMGYIRARQNKYQEAADFYLVALKDAVNATPDQKATALTQMSVIVCKDPGSTLEKVEKQLAEFLDFAYSSPSQQTEVLGVASAFYENKQNYEKALQFAQKQLLAGTKYDTGRILNKIADLYDLMQQKDKAIEVRKESVAHLRKNLNPVPVGIFGPMMAFDLVNALNGIPSSSAEEKREAANMALNHKVCPQNIKDAILKSLGDIDPGKKD